MEGGKGTVQKVSEGMHTAACKLAAEQEQPSCLVPLLPAPCGYRPTSPLRLVAGDRPAVRAQRQHARHEADEVVVLMLQAVAEGYMAEKHTA